MEMDYGILPLPKLDKEQKNYLSGVHASGTVLCVPKTVTDEKFNMVGAAFEALNGEAHRTYIGTFLDTALKVKYSRDALSGQCIDIILSGLAKNTLDEYSDYVNQIVKNCIVTPVINNTGIVASAIQKYQDGAQTRWDETVAALGD